jgi:NhaP-type Na+/H+ or K+/H+ antiporter
MIDIIIEWVLIGAFTYGIYLGLMKLNKIIFGFMLKPKDPTVLKVMETKGIKNKLKLIWNKSGDEKTKQEKTKHGKRR